jgi:hypothetical protein
VLSKVLDKLQASWDFDAIDGGNHSFELPKKEDVKMVTIYDRMVIKTFAWLRETFPQ